MRNLIFILFLITLPFNILASNEVVAFNKDVNSLYLISPLIVLFIITCISIYININLRNRLKIKKINIQQDKKMALAVEAANLLTWHYEEDKKIFTLLKGSNLLGYKQLYYTLEEHAKLVHPDDKGDLYPTLKRVLDGEIPKGRVQFRIITENGWMWVRCIFVPIEKNGKITGVTGVTLDITLEIEAEERAKKEFDIIKDEKDFMHTILNSLSIPIHIKNPKTDEYTFANIASEKIFGVKKGMKTNNIVHPDYIKDIRSIDASISEFGTPYEGPEIVALSDGRIIDTYVHKNLINYGGIKQILIARTDETEVNKGLRASKILSMSLPTIKAFSWFFDSREDFLYIYHNMKLERFKSNYVSDDDFIKAMHKEDLSAYLDEVFKLKSIDSGYSTLQFRADIEKIGSYEWWESHGTTETRYEDGVSYKIVCGLTININERKKSELQLFMLKQKSELILQNTNSNLIYIDTQFKILWSNMDLISKQNNKDRSDHEADNNLLCEYEKLCKDSNVKSVIDKKRTIESNRITLGKNLYDITYIPIIQGKEINGILIKLDNRTDHYNLIDEINKAKEKAEKSDKLKSAFLANMSHEIRTPLNAIVGFSDLISQADSFEDRMEYSNIINNNSELLLRLINDILDLSKIEAGLLEFKNNYFDINKVIDDLHSSFMLRKYDNVKLLSFKPEKDLFAYLDKNRFIQVLNNFLSNAVKYTPKGEITFGYIVNNNTLRVFVKDTGIGISEEDKKFVFQRFNKFNDFAQGTGLGLSICKAISDSDEKCNIGFESELGKGSEFWYDIECDMKRSCDINSISEIY